MNKLLIYSILKECCRRSVDKKVDKSENKFDSYIFLCAI